MSDQASLNAIMARVASRHQAAQVVARLTLDEPPRGRHGGFGVLSV
jgi:hypothetical protein